MRSVNAVFATSLSLPAHDDVLNTLRQHPQPHAVPCVAPGPAPCAVHPQPRTQTSAGIIPIKETKLNVALLPVSGFRETNLPPGSSCPSCLRFQSGFSSIYPLWPRVSCRYWILHLQFSPDCSDSVRPGCPPPVVLPFLALVPILFLSVLFLPAGSCLRSLPWL